ncbi:MAG: RidA family protein [Oligoflexia bacterium]|nr:RidA family protein [Oligoflexia bacterium]
MLNKKIIETPNAPKPVGPYSQAVQVGQFLFCSGQIAIDPKTNNVMGGPVKEQTKLVLENIKAILEAADANFENIVKTTIFLKRMGDFVAVNEVYGGYFKQNPPARSTVEVSALPKGVDVEIEVIAVV